MSTSPTEIAVLDYGMGNLRSVEKALEHVGAGAIVTGEHRAIEGAAGLILPGVGAFPEAMRRLRSAGLDELIVTRARAGVPLLGVCLGMQLLFDSSSEHEGSSGLGLLAGAVRPLRAEGLKLPHIGWSPLRFSRSSALTAGLEDGEPFYFVHSLVAEPENGEDVIADATHGERFAAIVGSGNVHGAQFHPEKSSRAGLAMLRNFVATATPAGLPA